MRQKAEEGLPDMASLGGASAILPAGPSSGLNILFLALRCEELLPGARGCGPVTEAPTPHWSLVLPSLCPKPTALCCTPSSALPRPQCQGFLRVPLSLDRGLPSVGAWQVPELCCGRCGRGWQGRGAQGRL